MNAEDKARAARIGREMEEGILSLSRLGRIRVEVETDARGHVRSNWKIEIGHVVSDKGPEEPSGE